MELKIGKKAAIPIHWIIIFVVVLVMVLIIAAGAFKDSGGLMDKLFSSMG